MECIIPEIATCASASELALRVEALAPRSRALLSRRIHRGPAEGSLSTVV